MDPSWARNMWVTLEPTHALYYFAPQTKDIFEAAGLKGYWMGYFAARAAAMGPVPPEVVMATFYNFHERMIRRAIPDAWSFSSPERILAARLEAAGISMRSFMAPLEPGAVDEAASLAETAARAGRLEGRPLFAAHASLPWPASPELRLWHAATLLREHRGDGHVATLVAHGIDGCEAHLLGAASGVIDPAAQRGFRGWSEEDWDAAAARLRARGILDEGGGFTPAGRELKDAIEARTDELAIPPYEAIGEQACARLRDLLEPAVRAARLPYPNPIGLPRA